MAGRNVKLPTSDSVKLSLNITVNCRLLKRGTLLTGICFQQVHCSSFLTGPRCRPGEVRALSIDEMAESRENADVASVREVDNIDRGVVTPIDRLLKWRKDVCVRSSCW